MGYAVVTGFYRSHELAFRTQYAELKERSLAAGTLLPGTPGSLALRSGSGRSYWYRVYYPVPGKAVDQLVGKEGDESTSLRKLGFQVADKTTARVLVELHNRQAFEAGLVLVGTLAYMAWLNELGAIAVSARTLDIDLARRQRLRLAVPLPFLATVQATGLPFAAVPGLPSSTPSTSVKLPGAQGLRVDVLAPGEKRGAKVSVPELEWAARFVWHKLYSSTQRRGFLEKAAKDRQQALVLGAVLADSESDALKRAFKRAPSTMIAPIRRVAKTLVSNSAAHPALAELLHECLGS
jgi:hypothetical protein